MKEKNFKAFTLAEVLVSLSIIGVVAALTIPAVIAKYQEKVWATGSSVFSRNLAEGMRMMNIEQRLSQYETTENFVSNLSKYLNITSICQNNELTKCFSNEIIWDDEVVDINDIKTAKNFGKNNWGTNAVAFQINNGSAAILAYNPNCNNNVNSIGSAEGVVVSTDCIAMVYDVSRDKTPNTFGKDIKTVNVDSFGKVNIEYTWDYVREQCGVLKKSASCNSCISSVLASTFLTKEDCDGLGIVSADNASSPTTHHYWDSNTNTCVFVGWEK